MGEPTHPDKDLPAKPGVDPRHGRNPGYAEERPDDAHEAHQPAPAPSSDEPGITRDPDAHPSP